VKRTIRGRARAGGPTDARPPPEDGDLIARRLGTLRQRKEKGSEDRLHLASLRIRMPRNIWTGMFSSQNPTVKLEALNRNDVDRDVSVSDYWISGTPPGIWASKIAAYPDVVKVDSLAGVGEGCIYRVTYRNPGIVYLYRRLQMPMQFPLHIQAGRIEWEVVARSEEFARLLAYAREVDPEFQVISIRRRPLRSHLPLLTETQQALLNEAMAAGYFAVPRRINLTDLAQRLGRSKSAVSEAIALIEKKLLESAVRPNSMFL